MAFIFSESHDSSDRSPLDFERLKRDSFDTGRWIVWHTAQTWRPPTDVYETDEAVIVRVEIAGMRDADFVVTVRNDLLTINGGRTDPSPKVAYHQFEVRYGEFRTEVFLHWAIEQSEITAAYQDGFLTVTLPKARVRRVRVTDAGEAAS